MDLPTPLLAGLHRTVKQLHLFCLYINARYQPVLFMTVERGSAGDKLSGRNINVSFTNNSNVPIEVMIFIFYSDEIAIDVKTGLVTRHKN
jgi:hypothetical protein